MSEEKARSAKAPKAVIEQEDDVKVDAGPSFAADSGEQGGSRRAASDAAEDPARVGGRFQDATMGFIEGVGRRAWAYADAHPHTVLYGAVGLLLAVLILALGLWHTIVIAIFVGVGATLGQMRDGEGGIHDFFSRIFGSKR